VGSEESIRCNGESAVLISAGDQYDRSRSIGTLHFDPHEAPLYADTE